MPVSSSLPPLMVSIHRAQPAATAPGAPSSTGMMKSTRRSRVWYSCGVNVPGEYAGLAASPAIWCTSRADALSTVPAAARAKAIRCSAARRETSDIALPHLLLQVLGGPPRERDDRVRGILVGIAHERRAVGDEEVAHVVRLAEAVERAAPPIIPHPYRADFVDDGTAARDRRPGDRLCRRPRRALAGRYVRRPRLWPGLSGRERLLRLDPAPAARWLHDSAQRFEDLAEGPLHVADLIQLVIAPLPVEAQDRYPPAIDGRGIDFAVAVLVGDHLAAAGQTDGAAVIGADGRFHLEPVAFGARERAVERAHRRHPVPAADLDVIPARKIEPLVVPVPPRHVQVRPVAVGVVARHARHGRDPRRQAGSDRVGQVPPDGTGGIGEPLRVPRR